MTMPAEYFRRHRFTPLVLRSASGRPAADSSIRKPGYEAAGIFVFAVLWSTLVLFLPMAIVDIPGAASWFSVFLQWFAVAYSGTHIAVIFCAGHPRWFDALFWSFAYIWIALAGFVQLVVEKNPYQIALSQESYQAAAALGIVGMVSYDLGAQLGRRISWKARPSRSRVLDKNRVIVLGIVSLAATPAIVAYLGGWGLLFVTRTERWEETLAAGLRSTDTQGSTAIASTLMIGLPLVALLATMRLIQTHPARRRQVGWIFLGATLLVLTLVVANPISSSRYWAGTAYMSIVLSTAFASRSSGFRITFAAAFAVLLVLFPYTDYFRNSLNNTHLQSMQSVIVSKADYDTALQMVNVIDYVNHVGYTYGRQLLGAITFFIPRFLWPDKPGSTGAVLAEFVHYPLSNISSPLWVESYIDGGWLGVMLIFVAVGLTASWIQSKSLAFGNGYVPLQVLLLPPAAAYSLILLRGSLMSNIGGLVAIVAIGWLISRPSTFAETEAATSLKC